MLSKEEVRSYKIPGLPPLKEHQINFFIDVMNGTEPSEAYNRHYPNRKSRLRKPITQLSATACALVKSKWFKQYREHFEKIVEEKRNNEIGWNWDLAVQERRRLYSLNLAEVERLAQAFTKEIEYYTRKKEEAMEMDDEKKVEEYERKIIKAIKAHNMSVASNTACQQALDGLDKLCGLQKINLNHSGEINFFGEDMWDDDDIEQEEN